VDYRQLTSPCGIDCFNCELYETNVTPELQQQIAAYKGVEPEAVVCGGCRETGCIMLAGACETKACVERHGVAFCYECDDFPCRFLHPCFDKAQDYPHNFKLYNLLRIRRVGLERWAEDEAGEVRRRYRTATLVIGAGPQYADDAD
jgi:hypothetical protein